MLQITPQMTLFLSVNVADFRKGIDALVSLCQLQLHQDPFSGALFAFTNRNHTAIKLLIYDGNGFWLCLKRFSKGKLKWWPSIQNASPVYHIDAMQLSILISQGDPENSALGLPWKRLSSQPT
jgi:transposase